jgi:hypothetical protein
VAVTQTCSLTPSSGSKGFDLETGERVVECDGCFADARPRGINNAARHGGGGLRPDNPSPQNNPQDRLQHDHHAEQYHS